jgi:ribonuclease HII
VLFNMDQYTIEEIRTLLNRSKLNQKLVNNLKTDSRKGVIKLIEKWEKQQAYIIDQQKLLHKMSTYERELYEQGYDLIAGIDEVGRGPLAGPVVAAAVILPKQFNILGINDSKQLSDAKREYYFQQIQEHAISVGIGMCHAQQIDKVNIYQATKIAMREAITQLKQFPDYLLIDAMKLEMDIPFQAIVKGDQQSVSIAASSIVAKVTRDRYMKRLAEDYPSYGFQTHMGYGTKQHLEAISSLGIISEHRRSFSPIKEVASS